MPRRPDRYEEELVTPQRTWLRHMLLLFFGGLLVAVDVKVVEIYKAHKEAEIAAMTAPAPEPPERAKMLRGEIERGVSVIGSFVDAGIPNDQANSVIAALRREGTFDFTTCRPGDRFYAQVTDSGKLTRFAYIINRLTHYNVQRNAEDTLVAERVVLPTDKTELVITGAIESSFYKSILDMGELTKLAANVVRFFEYDIDFVQEVRKGDTYRIFLERITFQDEVVDYGRIFAAEYKGEETGRVRGYWFESDSEKWRGYYNEKGQQMKKFLLRAPLDVLRVTSSFGMRFHPTLKRRKLHTGVDYGAPTGTSVWAVADGRVTHAGRAGGYGNMIAISHGFGLESRYAHLSRILVKRGQSVRQRQIIGRVGATGRATGPHLHFELRKNGRYINPRKVDIGTSVTLPAGLMGEFKKQMKQINEAWEAAPVLKDGKVRREGVFK